MKKTLMASAAALSTLGMVMAVPAVAGDMAHSYEITVVNTMETELIAPILVTSTESDAEIFTGSYVTPEAEVQVLTGDPKNLVERIGEGASVAHGEDGGPGVLLAPGKSLTFTVETEAPEIRLFAMVAPTMKPDNYLTTTIKLSPPMMPEKMSDTMADAMDTKAMADKGMADMPKDGMAQADAMMDDHVMVPAGRQLMIGDRGERVAMLRKRLGVDTMGANARVFDAELKSAVMDYQSKAGLKADGIVGRKTLAALNKPMDDTMMSGDTMAKDAMAKDTMADDTMAKDTMMKDSMAKDAMADDTMAKDTMMKDSMAADSMDKGEAMTKGDTMMEGEAMTATLHRFDIGHDEKTMTVTPVEGSFGTVTVKPL